MGKDRTFDDRMKVKKRLDKMKFPKLLQFPDCIGMFPECANYKEIGSECKTCPHSKGVLK